MENLYKQNFDNRLIVCSKKKIEKESLFEMHWHDYIEAEIILSGEAEHIYNSQVTRVGKGHAYIITPHDFHALHAKTDVSLLNISFDPNILEDDIKIALGLISEKNIYGILKEEALKAVVSMFEIIYSEQSSGGTLSYSMSRSVLCQLLINIIRLSDNNPDKRHIPVASKAIAYVRSNFKEPLTVSDVAEVMSVTPNYLGKQFFEYTGMSFNEYLNDIRLKCACNMLKFSAFSAKEIGLMSGYSSVEYFFSVFKKHIGMTPREYREAFLRK